MHTASNPFPNSVSPYPRDLRAGGPNLAGAGNIYPVDPAAVERLNAFMAQAPPRLRPPLSGEKGVVVGTGNGRNKRAQKQTEAAQKESTNQKAPAQKNSIRLTDPDAKEKLSAFLQERKALDDYSYTDELQAAIDQAETAVLGVSQKNGKGATKMENNKQAAAVETAVPSTSQKNGDAPAVDPAAIYPAEVIKAARKQATVKGRRDLVSVFTPEVLAVWHRWHEEDGRTMAWIAKHNGLLPITTQQVSDYLRKYRDELATPTELVEAAPETAVSPPSMPTGPIPDAAAPVEDVEPPEETAVADADPEPKPEIEPLQTAVAPFAAEKPENLPNFFDREYRPQRPGPAEAFAALAALAGNEQLRVRGSVKLNLEIEFGGE